MPVWMQKTDKKSENGEMQTLKIPAPGLANNLLGDPAEQPVAVYLPPGYMKKESKQSIIQLYICYLITARLSLTFFLI